MFYFGKSKTPYVLIIQSVLNTNTSHTVIPHLYPPPIVSQPQLYPRFSSGRISLIVNQYKSTSFVSHSDISLSPKFYGPDFPCSIIIYYDHTSFISPLYYTNIYLYNLCQVCQSFTVFNKFSHKSCANQATLISDHINQAT